MTKPLSKRVDAVVRHIMRNLHPDGAEAAPAVEGVPDFLTPSEVALVDDEIVLRLYGVVDTVRDRIAAKLPHLTEDQLAVLDQELNNAISPTVGKRPGLN
jgi:hypothetical protein